MLCLEVMINGEQRVLAGAAMAETLSASVTAHPGFDQGWIAVEGVIAPEEQPTAGAHWLSSTIAVGDVLQIRLVESNDPTPPRVGRVDLDTSPAPTDAIPFLCAFCGKEPKNVEGMLSSRNAMICHGCVRECYAIVVEQDAAAAKEGE